MRVHLHRNVQTGASQVTHQLLHRCGRDAKQVLLCDLIGPICILDPLVAMRATAEPEYDGLPSDRTASMQDIDRARDKLLRDAYRHVPAFFRSARVIWMTIPTIFMPSSLR